MAVVSGRVEKRVSLTRGEITERDLGELVERVREAARALIQGMQPVTILPSSRRTSSGGAGRG